MVIPALEILSKKQGHQQKNTIRSDVHSFDEYWLFAKCQALLWAPGGSAVNKTDKISAFLKLTIGELDNNICTYVSWS